MLNAIKLFQGSPKDSIIPTILFMSHENNVTGLTALDQLSSSAM